MSDEFWFGASCAAIVMLLVHVWTTQMYKRLLVDKANSKEPTAEKLPDGGFYYIVPEAQYVDLKITKSREDQAASERMKLSMSLTNMVTVFGNLLVLLRSKPEMQAQQYASLGIQCNTALNEARQALGENDGFGALRRKIEQHEQERQAA